MPSLLVFAIIGISLCIYWAARSDDTPSTPTDPRAYPPDQLPKPVSAKPLSEQLSKFQLRWYLFFNGIALFCLFWVIVLLLIKGGVIPVPESVAFWLFHEG